MTSLATAQVIGLVLLASSLVLVYFAAWIVCLCIQDTLSSRAALGLPAFRPSASREQRYLAYKVCLLSASLNFMHR